MGESAKKILVTGGCGFIGSYLCRELAKMGYAIRVIDIARNEKIEANYDFRQVDILGQEGLTEAMEGIDLVLHLAAKHKFFGVSEKEFFTVNETGTKNLLEAMDVNGVKSIIFFSTVAVYGDSNGTTNESTETKPNNPYGSSKLAAENLVRGWAEKDPERRAIIIRPTVVFGPGNKGNVYRLIRQIYYRGYLPIGPGDNIKSIAYIENLAAATVYLLKNGPHGVSVFNYADEPHMPYNEIVKMIYAGLGRSAPNFYLPLKPMLKAGRTVDRILEGLAIQFSVETAVQKVNKQTCHSAEKLQELGFIPMYTSGEGLKTMVLWYLEEKGAIRGEKFYEN